MPVLGKSVRIPIEVDGDIVVFLFPPYQSKDLRAAVTKLLKGRFLVTNQGDTKNVSYEARSGFFDTVCLGVENLYIDDEETIPLGPDTPQEELSAMDVNSWQELVPDHWKAEVASQFEESAVKARKGAESE